MVLGSMKGLVVLIVIMVQAPAPYQVLIFYHFSFFKIIMNVYLLLFWLFHKISYLILPIYDFVFCDNKKWRIIKI